MKATAEPLIMTKQLAEQYLSYLEEGERKDQTIRAYRKSMEELYDFLPEGKEITPGTLEEWKARLKEQGYSDSVINIRLSAANGLMKYCGVKTYTASHERIEPAENPPELTRAEYLQFLSAAREITTEQQYLLIKAFASMDIRIQELPYLTVEACRDGMIRMSGGRRIMIPACLRTELLQCATRRGIRSGPVFATRSGNPLNRANISRGIRQLAVKVGIEPEKCCPTALHRIYRRTQEKIKERILPIYMQAYDNLLDTEQALVSWEHSNAEKAPVEEEHPRRHN